MKPQFKRRSRKPLAAAIAASLALASGSAAALQVTGSFTGWWGQPQQENHGVIVSISRRADGSNQGVLYWAHYDLLGQPSWLYAEGPVVGDAIQAQLFRFDGVTFMQPNDPTTARGVPVGTMQVRFDDCTQAAVAFDSIEPGIGSGAFPIRRLTNQPGTSCSGGVSDNRSGDMPLQDFRAPLLPTGAVPGASGKVDYDANASRVEFEVEIEDVPAGDYELHVGGIQRATLRVVVTDDGPEGKVKFRSPVEPGKLLLDFEPLGELVEIIQNGSVILEGLVEPSANGAPGNPGTPGSGTPPFGDDEEIDVDLNNDGVYPAGSGDAEFEQRPNRLEFDVEIEDVPVGEYALFVDGIQRGVIEVSFFDDDDTEGELEFRHPPEPGKLPLDFDPRGQLIEIFDATNRIFHVDFPTEGIGDDDDDGPGDDDDDPGDGDGTTGEITVDLENAGVYPDGDGEAKWELDDDGEIDFDVEIEDVPTGDYTLRVGGLARGTITVTSSDDGTEGEIEFSSSSDDPDELPLDFDPRGQLIEVLEGNTLIFSATLPQE